MSWHPTLLLMQSFSTYPASETDFQWPPSVGYCYPFRGKFPVQGGIMIPINDDIIRAAKICTPSAKTFPCRGCNPYYSEILHYRQVMCLLCTGVWCMVIASLIVPLTPLKHQGIFICTFNHKAQTSACKHPALKADDGKRCFQALC